MFQVDSSFIKHEADVLASWIQRNLLKLFSQNDQYASNTFEFVDGPPFVSGSLHLGSLSISYLKDAVLRYQRMHGKKCTNQIGFDCHGLPSENMVMKLLNLNSNDEIEKYGVDKFIEKCIETIHQYSNSWEPTFNKIGRTVDFGNQYKTIDKDFMESVWWIFSEMNRKGLVYKAFKVMPYSWACETPLSNFEAGLAYKEIQTNSLYVKFPVKNEQNTYFVCWTTTTWTLPSNCSICVSPNIMYVKCYHENGDIYILSESCVKNLKMEFTKVEQIGNGTTLKGIEYEPLFDYMPYKYHKVLVNDYVKDTPEIGTGCVHQAWSHGEDDCRVGLENNAIQSKDLDQTCLIDSAGDFIQGTGELEGKNVFEVDKIIIQSLKQRNLFLLSQNYSHSYPHCYRTDKKLIYKIVSSHFVAVSQIKDQLLANNDKITWARPEIGNKRFRSWIENPKDWCISRNRYFGTPIPVWESEDGTESIVVESINRLVHLANLSERPNDLHLHTIKNIVIISPKSGKELKLTGTVFDCWFESGSVPYAQKHYPFDNPNVFDNKDFLCDFVAEGLDQTRGWFYTLLVISTIISGKPPFKNVICTGLILDKTGQKLSKRSGNFVDPNVLVDKYGADNIRLYLLSSPLVNGEPLMFNESEVHNLCKRMIPFINLIKFYSEQKTLMKKENKTFPIHYITTKNTQFNIQDITDTWILTKLTNLKLQVEQHMDQFHVNNAVVPLIDFVDDMTNWYAKIGRDRLKGKDGDIEQQISLSVLYTILYDYVLLLAPFAPFLSEHCYQYLTADFLTAPVIDQISFETLQFNKSVHLCQYPQSQRTYPYTAFEELKKIVLILRQLRSKSNTHEALRVPIKKCAIYHRQRQYLENIKNIIDIAHEEINCLEFDYCELSDDMYVYKPKINMRSLGQKCKKDKNNVETKINLLSQTELKLFEATNLINIDGYNLTNTDFELVVAPNIQSKHNTEIIFQDDLILEVNLTYDQEVHNLHHAKNFIFCVQRFRKHLGLKPWDDIAIKYECQSCEFLEKHSSFVEGKIGKPVVPFTGEQTDNQKTYSYSDFSENDLKVKIHLYVRN
jgi:isoleucyl-tRNA synthetase